MCRLNFKLLAPSLIPHYNFFQLLLHSGHIFGGLEGNPSDFSENLTYLYGTTTNNWLRPVEKDFSMSACLEHSAFNL
jgi:hypothetical protein